MHRQPLISTPRLDRVRAGWIRYLLAALVTLSPGYTQIPDSLVGPSPGQSPGQNQGLSPGLRSPGLRSPGLRSPKKAALYALAFPGGGQVYNHKFLKATLILGLEVLAFYSWQENAQAYADYDLDGYPLPKHRYLEKRNKFAWWMGFIYFYGLLDAVVDAHLSGFNDVMREDLEEPNQE